MATFFSSILLIFCPTYAIDFSDSGQSYKFHNIINQISHFRGY